MKTVIKRKVSDEQIEKLIIYFDLWINEWNWREYKKEIFPINVFHNLKSSRSQSDDFIDPQNAKQKRNDFIYWEMKKLGNTIINLQEVFSEYSIEDSWNRERFLKKINAKSDVTKSYENFLRQILKQPDSFERTIKIKKRLESGNSDEIIFFASKIHLDFCRVYDFLNAQFDSSMVIPDVFEKEQLIGSYIRTVLYHITLMDSGVENKIDRTKKLKEYKRLTLKYKLKSPKMFSNSFNAIDKNGSGSNGQKAFTFEDAEHVEYMLKRNYPDRPDILETLYDKTRPIYP